MKSRSLARSWLVRNPQLQAFFRVLALASPLDLEVAVALCTTRFSEFRAADLLGVRPDTLRRRIYRLAARLEARGLQFTNGAKPKVYFKDPTLWTASRQN